MPAADRAPSPQDYWNHAAESYDQDFAGTLVGKTHRQAVWRELDRVFSPGQRVLELSCGTGIDAVHLAGRGVLVLACDISPRMISLAHALGESAGVGQLVEFRVLPTEDLGELSDQGPFDGAFSNFSGLNCVEDLSEVRRNLARLLRPGAPVIFSVMGRFVPWEVIWFLAHGELRKAVRRCRPGDTFPLDSGAMQTQFRSVGAMSRLFSPEFRVKRWKGVGIGVPPSYMSRWAGRFSAATLALAQLDRLLGRLPVIRGMADCIVLEFERTELSGRK
jgi:SAM-dependent methyltransferase